MLYECKVFYKSVKVQGYIRIQHKKIERRIISYQTPILVGLYADNKSKVSSKVHLHIFTNFVLTFCCAEILKTTMVYFYWAQKKISNAGYWPSY